jgi:hypothetical protein
MWTLILLVLAIALIPLMVSGAAKLDEWFERRFDKVADPKERG